MKKAFLISIFCTAVLSQALFADEEWGNLIYTKDSLYHRIFVFKRDSVVTLRFGKQPTVQVQSQVDVNNLRHHMLEYTTLAFSGLLYKPEPTRILVVGLGGGVIPREMHHYYPSAEIDVAEIDDEIPKAATKFFGFREDDKLKVHIDDGRMFIKKILLSKNERKYDIIILDAFNSDYIPFHLMTKEFLEEVKGVLSDDGAVVANVFSNNRLYDAEFKTFLAVFGQCQVFAGTHSSNVMLVSPGPNAPLLTVRDAADRAQALQSKHRFSFNIMTVAERLRPGTRPASNAKVLTDDRAPVNELRRQQRRKTED